jgi:hypothetical protein
MIIKKEHLTDKGRLEIKFLTASGLPPLQQVGRQSPKYFICFCQYLLLT